MFTFIYRVSFSILLAINVKIEGTIEAHMSFGTRIPSIVVSAPHDHHNHDGNQDEYNHNNSQYT